MSTLSSDATAPTAAEVSQGLGADGFPIKAIKRKVYYKEGYSMELPARYELKELVGRGAYGVVVSAMDSVTNNLVAVKKISNMFADVVDGKRILREIKLLHFMNAPKHPNVLSLRDVFRPRKNTIVVNSLAAQFAEPGKPVPIPPMNTSDFFADVYLVSDFVATDLAKVIRGQDLTEDHCRMFAYQMCCGLHYIHSAGIIHRDMKPANMLVSENCELQIADFGLARCEGADNLTNYVVTRWYRPPELLLASELYDGKVDMWGVGCLAIEVLTRKPLFPGNDYINQLVLITDEIGKPTKDDLVKITSAEALAFLSTLPDPKPDFSALSNLAQRLPKCGSDNIDISPEFVDFLAKLLVFNPDKRMSALEAMRHPWLKDFYDAADERIVPPTKFQWEAEEKDLTVEELKDLTRQTVDEATLEDWRAAE